MYQNKLFDAKATNQCLSFLVIEVFTFAAWYQNYWNVIQYLYLKPCTILDSIENHDNEKAMLCEAMLCEVMQGETMLGKA